MGFPMICICFLKIRYNCFLKVMHACIVKSNVFVLNLTQLTTLVILQKKLLRNFFTVGMPRPFYT